MQELMYHLSSTCTPEKTFWCIWLYLKSVKSHLVIFALWVIPALSNVWTQFLIFALCYIYTQIYLHSVISILSHTCIQLILALSYICSQLNLHLVIFGLKNICTKLYLWSVIFALSYICTSLYLHSNISAISYISKYNWGQV